MKMQSKKKENMHKKLLRLNTDELYPARFIARVFGKYESGGSFRYFRIRKIAELPEKVTGQWYAIPCEQQF